MFAPVFEATVTSSGGESCPLQWAISGPGSIVGASNTSLLTVNGNSTGNVLLSVFTRGGTFADTFAPVVDQRVVDVRAYIVRETDGSNPATTQARVDNDISDANLIWQQCGIQFRLVSTSFINSTTFLRPPDQATRDLLRNHAASTGGFEIYYVEECLDSPDPGYHTVDGIVITRAGNTRTAAHELGHGMGILHSGIADLHLMHDVFSTVKADITLGECEGVSRFASN